MIKYINREQLYKQVWSEPFTKLAPKHNVSVANLKNLCNKFCIPIPKQGHWQRVAFGHKIEIPDLKIYACFSLKTKKRSTPFLRKKTEPIIKINNRESIAEKYKIEVRKKLTKPHLIIAKAKSKLESQKPDEYGMLRTEGKYADIRISPNNSKEVLRVLDALFKWFEARGHKVEVEGRYATSIIIDGEAVDISVEEKSKITKSTLVNNGYWTHTEREYTPTNKISLLIKSYVRGVNPRKTWSTGKFNTLEDLLPIFIDAIFEFARIKKEDTIKREQEDKARADARLRREYEAKCEAYENEMISKLEQQVKDWHFSMQLKSYIEAVEAKVREEGDTLVKETQGWLVWANKHLERIDPLNQGLPTYVKAEQQVKSEDLE